MSEWIPTKISNPPEALSVLLYVVFYYEDGVNVWDEKILTGFYGDEDWDQKGFYLETISKEDSFTMSYELIEESKIVKVLAWTPLPRKPYNPKFDREEWSW